MRGVKKTYPVEYRVGISIPWLAKATPKYYNEQSRINFFLRQMFNGYFLKKM